MLEVGTEFCVASDAMRGFGLRFPHFNFANGVQVDVKTMGAILVLVVTTESLKIILLEVLILGE